MKKLVCLVLALVMCMAAIPAFALVIPASTSNLPGMLRMPDTPKVIRVQKDGPTITITLDRELPAECLVTMRAYTSDYHIVEVNAVPGENNTHTAIGLPADGTWMEIDIAWAAGNVNAVAHYDDMGGLKTVTRYDSYLNEYVFDNDGYFKEFGYTGTSVRARFDTSGKLTGYAYEAFPNTQVWFNVYSEVVCAYYDDGNFAATWAPSYGWYVSTASGRIEAELNINPWNASPLHYTAEADKPEVDIAYYPNNTISLAGLTLQEASTSLPDKWYNVLPINLTQEGRQTYYLTISNMCYIGRCYVDVYDGEVTVSCTLIEDPAIELLSTYGRWFTNLSQVTTESIESSEDGFTFGEPVSIADDLGGADVALLFIRSKATYYLPFRDGTELTRYWRNMTEWKEFRKDLQELMPYVEK